MVVVCVWLVIVSVIILFGVKLIMLLWVFVDVEEIGFDMVSYGEFVYGY